MEPNDNQNISPKKPKNINDMHFEVVTKIFRVFRLPSFREGFLIVFCFSLLITLLQLNLYPPIITILRLDKQVKKRFILQKILWIARQPS